MGSRRNYICIVLCALGTRPATGSVVVCTMYVSWRLNPNPQWLGKDNDRTACFEHVRVRATGNE